MREREKRLASDFNELEEENCSLQKTLAHLKQQQLAIDSLQHESARLEEESAFWKAKSEEEESIKNGKNNNNFYMIFHKNNIPAFIIILKINFSFEKSAGRMSSKF